MSLLTYALLCVSSIVFFHRHRSVSVKWQAWHLCWYSFLSCFAGQFLVIEDLRWFKDHFLYFSLLLLYLEVMFSKEDISQWNSMSNTYNKWLKRLLSSETLHCHQQQTQGLVSSQFHVGLLFTELKSFVVLLCENFGSSNVGGSLFPSLRPLPEDPAESANCLNCLQLILEGKLWRT